MADNPTPASGIEIRSLYKVFGSNAATKPRPVQPLYVGMAATSHNTTTATSAKFRAFNVT